MGREIMITITEMDSIQEFFVLFVAINPIPVGRVTTQAGAPP